MQQSCPYTVEELRALVRPVPRARYEVSVGFRFLEKQLDQLSQDYGLELIPDFQRGHVWTQSQQESWIEAVLRGAISSSGLVVQFNSPTWDSINPFGDPSDLPCTIQCIDGLQRLTAVRRFILGEIKAFGLTSDQFDSTEYSVKRISTFRLIFAVHSFKTRAELLTYYLDLNAGGTPHSAEEIDRVRGLLPSVASV